MQTPGTGRQAVTTQRTMHVDEAGTPGTPAVVFLHGAGASGRMWREHVAALAGSFHCLAPDLPGFGRSNHLPPASLDQTADLIAGLIETRVPARRAHVVGLSWGGGVSHVLLGRRPELIDRAVIDGAGVLSWRGGILVRLGVTAMAPFLHTRPVVDFLGDMIGMDEEGRDELRASTRRAFRAAFMEGFSPRPPSPLEAAAACPTLLVAGEGEDLVRPSNAALAAVMTHAAAVYAPGLAHGWLARRVELHFRMVEAWLTGRELPSELAPEPPAPAAVERLIRELGKETGRADDRPAAQPR
jgi:pimeloyl-ACP methyl ester carboxylesterase